MHNDWLQPEWSMPSNVGAVMCTRKGGVSITPFDTMNVGMRVGDAGAAVERNRQALQEAIRAKPVFLHQVHGVKVVQLTASDAAEVGDLDERYEADAAFTTEPVVACVVQVADCLPVLMASGDGRVVGAAHAGWRGLAAGVLENTLHAMHQATGCPINAMHVWLGPCIGPSAFEVGADVRDAFADHEPCFKPAPRGDGSMRWLADLPGLARARLVRLGVASVTGGSWCTVSEPLRFFSYRRDRITGRHAAAIWRNASPR